VWKAVDPQIPMNHVLDYYNFKIVPNISKRPVKQRPTISPLPERMDSVTDFVGKFLTKNLLEQGISILKEDGYEISRKSTSKFMSWIINDIQKEETDTLVESGISIKDVQHLINQRSREWFFKYISENL